MPLRVHYSYCQPVLRVVGVFDGAGVQPGNGHRKKIAGRVSGPTVGVVQVEFIQSAKVLLKEIGMSRYTLDLVQ